MFDFGSNETINHGNSIRFRVVGHIQFLLCPSPYDFEISHTHTKSEKDNIYSMPMRSVGNVAAVKDKIVTSYYLRN